MKNARENGERTLTHSAQNKIVLLSIALWTT